MSLSYLCVVVVTAWTWYGDIGVAVLFHPFEKLHFYLGITST